MPTTPADPQNSDQTLADDAQRRIGVLMEEYRALYTLVTFRMGSLDRRVPIATAALATFLGSIAAVPPASQAVFLVGLPLAQLWLVRTTINHARSFEDVLRRIDQIERRVNQLAGEDLLVFQSRHPSGGRATGGRTGVETVRTVYSSALLMLAACGYLAPLAFESPATIAAYRVGCGLIALQITVSMLMLGRYRYPAVPTLTGRSSAHRAATRRAWPCTGRLARRARSSRRRRRSRAGTTRAAPAPSTAPPGGGTAAGR